MFESTKLHKILILIHIDVIMYMRCWRVLYPGETLFPIFDDYLIKVSSQCKLLYYIKVELNSIYVSLSWQRKVKHTYFLHLFVILKLTYSNGHRKASGKLCLSLTNSFK